MKILTRSYKLLEMVTRYINQLMCNVNNFLLLQTLFNRVQLHFDMTELTVSFFLTQDAAEKKEIFKEL